MAASPPSDQRTRTSLGWWVGGRRLVTHTIRDSIDDRLPGLAAEVSFYVLLALPPLLLVALGALSFVGELFGQEAVQTVRDQVVEAAGAVFTQSTIEDVVSPAIDDLLAQSRADVLSVGVLLALWSASRALRVIVQAVTFAYDVEDRRSWWQHRLLGLGLTTAGVIVFAVLLPLLVVGPEAGEALASRFGLDDTFDLVWRRLYFPVVVVVGLSLLTWVYHVVPPHYTRWRRDVPGAVLALVIWGMGSFGLRIYATSFLTADSAYGYFATPIVLLLWVYVTAIALLAGAEVNAEIEKLWPEGGPATPPQPSRPQV